jgi:hypothetical protein
LILDVIVLLNRIVYASFGAFDLVFLEETRELADASYRVWIRFTQQASLRIANS